ncbi:MAG: dihydrolipoamide acetyltransferase family protein [Steroidobacteraceae bacterium]
MSRYVFKLPDLGEGTVSAEIVSWHVKPGDTVEEEQVLVEVMTEKAAVEVPSPVGGRVISTTGEPGEMVAVGAELIVFETGAEQSSAPAPAAAAAPAAVAAPAGARAPLPQVPPATARGRVMASPANRRRAHEAGIDLQQVRGSGPQGRILREDLEVHLRSAPPAESAGAARAGAAPPRASALTEEIKVIGLRRLIAQRMSEAKRNIPHFAYVEEIDVSELEGLRRHLNARLASGEPALTYLPFLVVALVRVLKDFPQCNAHYDAERGVIIRHRAVHVGVATQTPDGLKVPVVRNAEQRSLWGIAAEMRRVTEGARTNKATREELTGSTITLTSLGKLGGIVSTPIINAPEVAILGVNRAVDRPMVVDGAVAVRRMMNLSSSFDHRFVDGYDAAAMIQAMKELLEHPAMIFMHAKD